MVLPPHVIGSCWTSNVWKTSKTTESEISLALALYHWRPGHNSSSSLATFCARRRINPPTSTAISRHLKYAHGLKTIGDLSSNFSVLKKCNGKLDCPIYEILFPKHTIRFHPDKTVCLTYFHLHVQTCYFSSLFCHFKPYILGQFLVLRLWLDNDVMTTSNG